MKLVGMMPVRNEDWILGYSLRAALEWCDEVVVLLHACTDTTEAIVEELRYKNFNRIVRLDDPLWRWDEMAHRQEMLEAARRRGATHLAIIDADEVLTVNLTDTVRELCETLPPSTMLELPGYNLRNGFQYHANGVWSNRWFATAFLDSPALHWAGDRFHHRSPMGASWRAFRPIQQHDGGVLHFWGFDERRLIAKHALYKITERLRWPHKDSETINQQYNLAIHAPDNVAWTYAPVPRPWIPRGHESISTAEAPWQEAECRRLVEKHGRDAFRGLDLFGVA